MSNPGDRWRRGWLLLVAALVAAIALLLARCTVDNNNRNVVGDSAEVLHGTPRTVEPFGLELSERGILLSGAVSTEAEHQRLVALAASTWPGVPVDDRIFVVNTAPLGDLDAMFTALSAAVPPLRLSADSTTLTLTGQVRNEEIRDALGERLAAATGRKVDNQLTIAGLVDVPTTAAPGTEVPPVDPEATTPSVTEPPDTEPPATEPPATEPPTTIAPETTTTLAPDAAATVQAIADEIKLDGIQFVTGSAELTPEATSTLGKVADTLNAHPDVKIAIGGHTDNTGNAASNLKLSQQRADAVRAYLVTKSVDAARLTAVGYGQDRPIDDNSTDAGRTRNRRIEFTPA